MKVEKQEKLWLSGALIYMFPWKRNKRKLRGMVVYQKGDKGVAYGFFNPKIHSSDLLDLPINEYYPKI